MPWSASEATSFTKKANTPKRRRQWAQVANAMLKQTGSESKAVRAANAAMMNEDAMQDAFKPRRRRKLQQYDPFGRAGGYYEEEDTLRLPLFIEVVDAPFTNKMMYDAIDMSDAKLEITSDGYLKAMPRIARTGIQLYKGDECGRPDIDVVRVYRPEDSVFHNDATHSYTHLPITIDHPGTAVDSKNWRKHAVGETGDEVLRDGGTVRVPMMLRDAEAIKLVQSGKRELSVGYGCNLDWTSGITSDGESYDAIQRDIRGNHLAIVTQARGGSTLRIGDDAMTELRTVLIDGLPCQMSDKDAAIVQRTIQQLQDQNEFFKKFKKGKEEEEEEKEKEDAATIKAKDAEIATRDGKIAALEQQVKDAQLTPEKLDAMVNDRLAIRDQVRKLLPSFKCDGKSDTDIRRAVVASKLGDERTRAMSDENVAGAYQAYASTSSPAAPNPINDARAAFAHIGVNDGQNPKVAAYNAMVHDMEQAYKTPA
jgi:hypothetical protein